MRHHINRSLSNALLVLAGVGDLLPLDSPQAQTLAEAMRLVESLDTRPTQGDDKRMDVAGGNFEDVATVSTMTH